MATGCVLCHSHDLYPMRQIFIEHVYERYQQNHLEFACHQNESFVTRTVCQHDMSLSTLS